MKNLVFALLLLLGSAEAAGAQNLDIAQLQDRLAEEKDINLLRRREFALARQSATNNDALMERGMVLVRIYQLSRDPKDGREAVGIMSRALKKAPDDPRALYGLAVARSGGPWVRIPSPLGVLDKITLAQSAAEIFGRDRVTLAKKDLKKALDIEPMFIRAAIELANISMDTQDKEYMRIAANALRAMVDAKRGGTVAAVALSEVENALGNVDAAAKAAELATSIAVGTENSAAAEHARAVALLRQPEKVEEGGRVYVRGIENLTEKTAETYFDAVRSIASDREKADWESADLAGKQEWLRKFWNVRAASGGITLAERMAEHYKRLAIANAKYRRTSVRGAAPGGSLVAAKYNSDMLPFDDRGVIYVRHGAPDEIVHTTHVDLRPNETWVYRRNGKNTLYNFVVLRDGSDYRLVDDLLLALDPSTRGVPTDAAAKLLRDRQAHEPRYAAIAAKYDGYDRAARGFARVGSATSADEAARSINNAATAIAADMRREAFVALETDTDVPDFKSDLPFYYDLYAFRGRGGMTDVTAAAAIPGTSLFSQSIGTQFIYSIEASLIFIDTVTDEITRKDSVFTYLSSRLLGDNEHLRMTMDMSIRHAKSGVHRIVLRDRVNPGVGQLYGGPSDLKNYTGEGLMLSDIILAESEDGAWQRGDAKLGLVPPRQFEEKKPLKLFYEIYNLPPDASYRTEILMSPVEGATAFGRLKKLFGGSDGTVQLAFDGITPSNTLGTIQELKQVSTEMKPGKYRIVVRVINQDNGQSVRSETLFVVSGKKK